MKLKILDKKVYGYWRVLSDPFKINRTYYVEAICTACNKTKKKVKKNNLLRGTSKSCGCIQRNKIGLYSKDKTAHNSVDIFTRETKKILQNYKFGAKKRKLDFELSLVDLQKMITMPCTYCGNTNSNKTNTQKGTFKYNGIDRWDNSLGYSIKNCLPCCVRCNRMKNDIDNGSDFIEHIKKILNNHVNHVVFDEKRLKKYEPRLNAIKQNSHDVETQVAAILIDPKTGATIAEGYNGFIRGAMDSQLPNKRPEKYPYMIHAEANVIYNAIRSGVSTDEKILFCTLSPCINCMRSLWQCGVSVIFFKDRYRDFNQQKNMLDLSFTEEKMGEYTKIVLKPRS